MKTTGRFALAAAVLTLAVAVSAHEKRVKLKDLPAAVRQTVLEQAKGGTILALDAESEDGKITYEAELQAAAGRKDVSIDSAGAVIESEGSVALSSLTAAVKAGLEKDAGKGRIVKVEAISKNGAATMYEAQVRTGGKKFEIKVGPEGTAIVESGKGDEAD